MVLPSRTSCSRSSRLTRLYLLLSTLLICSSSNAFAVPSSSMTQRSTVTSSSSSNNRQQQHQPVMSPYKKSSQTTKRNYSLIPLTEFANPIWKASGIYVLANTVGFLISLATGSHVHLDLIGSGAFALAAWPGMVLSAASTGTITSPHMKWSSLAVFVWATKLATFLFYRATRVGHDMRLEEMLSSVSGTASFWLITFMWNFCCSMPYLLGLSSTRTDPILCKLGGVVYLLGLAIETLADAQKFAFKNSHPGQFCNVGLWSISQHPNFFGNFVLWAGIFLMNLPALIDPAPIIVADGSIMSRVWSYRRFMVALISPIFMWTLLNGQAQGTATNANALGAAKYGSDPDYAKYITEVPQIIPKLWW